MSNVISMSGGYQPAPGQVNTALVEMLENILEDAKSGKLQSLVATGFMDDGLRYALWCDTHPNVYEMLGAIAWLHAEYIERTT